MGPLARLLLGHCPPGRWSKMGRPEIESTDHYQGTRPVHIGVRPDRRQPATRSSQSPTEGLTLHQTARTAPLAQGRPSYGQTERSVHYDRPDEGHREPPVRQQGLQNAFTRTAQHGGRAFRARLHAPSSVCAGQGVGDDVTFPAHPWCKAQRNLHATGRTARQMENPPRRSACNRSTPRATGPHRQRSGLGRFQP